MSQKQTYYLTKDTTISSELQKLLLRHTYSLHKMADWDQVNKWIQFFWVSTLMSVYVFIYKPIVCLYSLYSTSIFSANALGENYKLFSLKW